MPRPWNSPERDVTPDSVLTSRRTALKWLGLGGIALGSAAGLWWWRHRGSDAEVLGTGKANGRFNASYPAPPNGRFSNDRPETNEADMARWCNFYEFAFDKAVWRHVERFQPEPWTLEIGGLVAKPRTYDLDDLYEQFSLEERIYRHRCVEAWAMVVPWTGFPLAALFKQAEPLPEARFVRFISFHRPDQAPGQRSTEPPWPYTEGLTLAEATNELSFMAVGMYGHPLLKQNGAPVRLVVPWKYGFKSAKSVVRIELTASRPATFWNTLVPHEYGFEANVEPDVAHPRWSQRQERLLGTREVRPTLLYNGYGEWVASLYS
jgi:sulfoxide reductase catalytic subunit YedY